MMTITLQEAERGLSHYLDAVENGEEVVIARDAVPVAKIVPIELTPKRPRPKVGEILGEAFHFPASAFAPMSEDELKEWGL